MKRFWIGAILISMLASVPALAQYPDDDDDDDGGTTTPIGITSDDMNNDSMKMKKDNKPDDFTFAVGAGGTYPNDVLNINYFHGKFFLVSGMQVEPFVSAGINRGAVLFDDGTTDTEDDTGATFAGVGARGKYPWMRGNNVDLHIIGEAQLAFVSAFTDPDGSDNTVTDVTTSIALGWGLGVEWWFLPQMSVEALATNPLVSFTNNKNTQDTAADDVVNTTRDFTFQATFDPTVTVAVNFWFN